MLRLKVAGPDGISWLMPDHLDGPLMSRGLLRLNQPRSNLFRHHFENACAIRGVLFREIEMPCGRRYRAQITADTVVV